MAKKRQVDELLERQEQKRQERRRARHDELKGEYLAAFEALGGTAEEFEALWPNLGQSVIGQGAIERVGREKAQARRRMRAVWGGRGGQGLEKGAG